MINLDSAVGSRDCYVVDGSVNLRVEADLGSKSSLHFTDQKPFKDETRDMCFTSDL